MRTSALMTIGLVGLWMAMASGSVGAQPVLTGGARWQLDFAFHDPQRITVRLPGQSEAVTYWYVLYTVTNETGRDVEFYPSSTLVTDTLQTVEAGAHIHPSVYERIRARHAKQYPFFAPPTKVTGLLLQGKPNARTSAAVFERFDPKANEFTIYCAGLSGRIRRIANPVYDKSLGESDDNPPFFILRRTLALTYRLPGDLESRSQAVPIRLRRWWVMR